MIKNLLDRIPEKLLRKLASDRGHVLGPGESIEEVKNGSCPTTGKESMRLPAGGEA
jgi:hypothetical protein